MKRVFDFLYNKYRNKILYVVFMIYVLVGVARNSTLMNIHFWDVVFSVARIACGIILALYLLLDFIKGKFKITIFLVIGVICAVGALFFAHSMALCFLLAFIYVFKDCEFKQIAKIYTVTVITGVIIIYFLALVGYIENLVQSRGEMDRVCMGFLWSVPPMTYFFFSCLVFNFIVGEKISYLQLILEMLINFTLYYLTQTRTGFILVCVLILTSFVVKVFNTKKIQNYFSDDKVNKICAKIFALMPILFIAIFGILVLLFAQDINIITKINTLLSGRLELTYNAFRNRKITIFGGVYDWTENGRYIGVDSAFYHYLFNYGFLPTLFILFVTIFLFYKTFREKKYGLCFVLFLVLCDSFIDIFYWDIRYNIFLLVLIEGNIGRKMMFGEETAPVYTYGIRKRRE